MRTPEFGSAVPAATTDRLNLDISEISSNNDESDNDIDRSDFIRTLKESMSNFTKKLLNA